MFGTIKASGGQGDTGSDGCAVDGGSSGITGSDGFSGDGPDLSENNVIYGSNHHDTDGSDGVISRGGQKESVVSESKWQRKKEGTTGRKYAKEANAQEIYRNQRLVQEKRMVDSLQSKAEDKKLGTKLLAETNILLVCSS